MPPETPKKEPQCHIHDKVERMMIRKIRERVCVKEVALEDFEGKPYCLFHKPTEDKDKKKFEEILNKRLNDVETEIKRIKAEAAEDEREDLIDKLRYDFRYVWFPSYVSFTYYEFKTAVVFSSATFNSTAAFLSTIFNSDASFNSTIFNSNAYFISAIFNSNAYFKSAIFNSDATFKSAVFNSNASFWSAKFGEKAFFNRTKFGKTGKTFFSSAQFAGDSFFDRTRFRNRVSFNSAIFADGSDMIFRGAFFAKSADFQYATAIGYLRFRELRLGSKTVLDFQEAAFEKAARVSFYRMRLRPGWFINVDSRKMVFTDIDWQNLRNNYGNENLNGELENLEWRGVAKPKQLFKIACRQLSENAEANSRYEEASHLRRMAMETEWFEKKEDFWKCIENFKNESREPGERKPGFKEKLFEFLRQLRDVLLHKLYRISSSYGERWGRAFVVLLLILAFFAAVYTQVDFQNYPKDKPVSESAALCKAEPKNEICPQQGLPLRDAVAHSLSTATFQNVDYRKPVSEWGEIWVTLEKIFAPLQAALLALAIRRKFMR